MSEKLCLNWNDFGGNFKTAFEELRRDKDFCDVTLACEDGQQFEAHKVILVTSSPFFHNLFNMHQQSPNDILEGNQVSKFECHY